MIMLLKEKLETSSAIKIIIYGINYILVLLRLPFGGSSCPSDLFLTNIL